MFSTKNFIDNLWKILLAMVDDIRIVLIKLAERLVTLRFLRNQCSSLQKDIA
ncbi:HD domain-containing protein [Candidatus Coxiella mudrowiae]|uniref:HD domain-containing protein n=1 Tax=Candidatus Coxiella mudrowiae TaxID=2054173 RepID=UPI00352D1EC1